MPNGTANSEMSKSKTMVNATREVSSRERAFREGGIPSLVETQVRDATDRIVDFNFHAAQRWTSYQSRNESDWLQIEFANDNEFSRVDLAIYDEGPKGGVQTPEGYSVEYWTGEAWKAVPEQKKEPASPVGNAWNKASFPKLSARKVRVVFDHRGNARSGVSEIAIWP